ncbi:MAG: hypothetical protein HYT87_00270 [Nitrospirae bacterium]|nr:hypothetical protein [Nitrospirota bacterium]
MWSWDNMGLMFSAMFAYTTLLVGYFWWDSSRKRRILPKWFVQRFRSRKTVREESNGESESLAA